MSKATHAPTLNGAGGTIPAVRLPARKPPKPAAPRQPSTLLETILYAAADPGIDIAKVEHLIRLRKEMEAAEAERLFNEALAAAQAGMAPVVADAVNQHANGHKYATYAQLDRAIRPIYSAKGLAVTFTAGERSTDIAVEVVAYLIGHGHSRRYVLLVPADGKGAKGGDVMSRTHATASAISYGMRYLAVMIFNLSIDRDDDGNAAGQRPKSAAQARRENGYPQLERRLRACRSMPDLEAVWRELAPQITTWPERWRQHAINEKNANKMRLDPMAQLSDSLHYLDREGGF
jgi:ERF superfamily